MGLSNADTNDATSRHSEITLICHFRYLEILNYNVNLPAGILSF